MMVTLHLKPELEAGLMVKAQANGMGLEDYLLFVVEGSVLPRREDCAAATEIERAEAVRRMIAFGERYRLSLGEPIRRELLHEDHRF